jgi:hypothetical protein
MRTDHSYVREALFCTRQHHVRSHSCRVEHEFEDCDIDAQSDLIAARRWRWMHEECRATPVHLGKPGVEVRIAQIVAGNMSAAGDAIELEDVQRIRHFLAARIHVVQRRNGEGTKAFRIAGDDRGENLAA